MPSVRNDATRTEGASGTAKWTASADIAATGAAGKPPPKQHDAQVEQACA
ncbi:hypothetical protein LMG24238_02055 [Paraburkholderia sediminicola]|uniref:Uncharacterized protein n=1 Tax=Paraburkholderia sediminicola TaxID=458836 RepID=A0A6J5AQH4_9BURK|nr:hypothetical protein LMG24238_02055 [Paraburkholderia sediminicola]